MTGKPKIAVTESALLQRKAAKASAEARAILKYLRAVAREGRGRGIEGFVLGRGSCHPPQPLPAFYKCRSAKKCFMNSGRLALQNGLRYFEGYAMSSSGNIVHHAWCVDEQDKVIDTTWRDPGLAYVGVPFPVTTVAANALKTGFWGSVIEGHLQFLALPNIPDVM